jgi:hypothetical protein
MRLGASTGIRVQAKNQSSERSKNVHNGWTKLHLKGENDRQIVN